MKKVKIKTAEMDSELKQYLIEMESRMDARISQLETRMDARFAESETRMDARFAESEARMKEHVSERIEALETKLLTEFWKWGRTSEMRTKQAMADVNMFGERLLALEDRVTALEFKRHPGAM